MTTPNTNTEVVKKDERFMEYVPFGAQDKIRLSIAIVRRLIAVPTASGKVPTDDDCVKFQMMCQAKRLNPFEGDAFMIGYDTKFGPKFSQITAHQVFLKRAEKSSEYDGMESGVIVIRKLGNQESLHEPEGDFLLPGDALVGGWAKVYFKSRSHPMYKRINLSVFDKGRSQWEANKAGMIVKCAEADALRSSFPNLLGNLYISEETDREAEPPKVAKPIFKDQTAIAAPIPEPVEDKAAAELEKLEALCDRDAVDHNELISLLQASGLAGDGCGSLKELASDDVSGAINNWEALMKNLKGKTE